MRYIILIDILSVTLKGFTHYQAVKSKTLGLNRYCDYAYAVKLVNTDERLHVLGLEEGEYNGTDLYQATYYPMDLDLNLSGTSQDYPSNWEPGASIIPRYFPIDIISTKDQGTLLYCLADDLSDPNQNNWVPRIPTLIKLDSTGKEEWLVRYTDYRDYFFGMKDESVDVLFEVDGGYMIANSWPIQNENGATSAPIGNQDLWLMKVDYQGSQQWVKGYGGTSKEINFGGVQKENGNVGFLLSTTSTDVDLSSRSDSGITGWYVELDSEGELVRNQTFVTPGIEANEPSSTVIIYDLLYRNGRLLILGDYMLKSESLPNHNDTSKYKGDGFWFEYLIDSNTVLAPHFYGGTRPDYFNCGLYLQDGTIAFGGYVVSKDGDLDGKPDSTKGDAWFVQVDSLGEIVQMLTFDKPNTFRQQIFSMVEVNEDIYCLASIETIANNIYWIIKLSKTSTGLYEEVSRKPIIKAFPNPNNTGLLNTNLKANYSLLDMQGRILKSYIQSDVLDISDINSGTYLLQHESGAVVKIVVGY